MAPTKHSTFRLSPEALALLARLATHYGLSRTSALEFAIREQARRLKLTPTKEKS